MSDEKRELSMGAVRYHLENIAEYAQRCVFYKDEAYRGECERSQQLLIAEFERIKKENEEILSANIELEIQNRYLKGAINNGR